MEGVTPSTVGPLGGGVLLVHGAALPFRALQLRQAAIHVGTSPCPFLASRSDPRGTFLACACPPPPANFTDAATFAVTIQGATTLSCPACIVTFSTATAAEATLLLSKLRGAAGDVITLLGVGAWPHLRGSHGLHEQVDALIGGHPAVPRHPASTAVSRSASNSWRVELAMPFATAGQHDLHVTLDRLWRHEHASHGTVLLDGAAQASVTILPAVHQIELSPWWRSTSVDPFLPSSSAKLLWLHGSGFSPALANNSVRFGCWPCVVRSATANLLSCELDGGGSGAATTTTGAAAAAASSSSKGGGGSSSGSGRGSSALAKCDAQPMSYGPGLTFLRIPLRAYRRECVTSLMRARSLHCAVSTASPSLITLRQQLIFPHHTRERQGLETHHAPGYGRDRGRQGGQEGGRQNDPQQPSQNESSTEHVPALFAAVGVLTPPVDGYYTLSVETDSADAACSLALDMDTQAAPTATAGAYPSASPPKLKPSLAAATAAAATAAVATAAAAATVGAAVGAAGAMAGPATAARTPSAAEAASEASDPTASAEVQSACGTGRLWLRQGERYPVAIHAIGSWLAVRASVQPAAKGGFGWKPTDKNPEAGATDEVIDLPAAPAEWFEQPMAMVPVQAVAGAGAQVEAQAGLTAAATAAAAAAEATAEMAAGATAVPLMVEAHLSVNGIEAVCRSTSPNGCTVEIMPPEAPRSAPSMSTHRSVWTDFITTNVPLPPSHPDTPPPSTLPAVSPVSAELHGRGLQGRRIQGGRMQGVAVRDAGVQTSRRQLESTCSRTYSCCVVIYRGARGANCAPVPIWDLSTWVHPGGSFITSSMLCNTVRYSWFERGQHATQMDPEDASQESLTGGGIKVGEFIDPTCTSSDGDGDADGGSGLASLEQRWSSWSHVAGFGASDDVVVPTGAAWLLDVNMTVASLTVRGALRWDTSVDGLQLSAGYVVVERGGSFELGTIDEPMLMRATIHLRHLPNVSHPYLGSRVLALDGLASSALDGTAPALKPKSFLGAASTPSISPAQPNFAH